VPPPGAAQPVAAAARGGVLYVEDHPINVVLVREILKLRPAVPLWIAAGLQEARAIAGAEAIALMLVDMHLQDLHGTELKAILQQEFTLPGVAWVAVSADATATSIDAATAAGFDDYLTKPLDVAVFLACVDRHLQASGARP
jgi:CheY-like chemotaxis protein